MNRIVYLFILIIPAFSGCGLQDRNNKQAEIHGWNILTDHMQTALNTLEACKRYEVNHLQLSHEICHDLKDIKHQWNRNIVNTLTQMAHESGIPEVVVWDHALYSLSYYPDRFKTDGKINLDDPEFWEWFKNDYRGMLDRIPEIDGIVLTFIETGARIENQHSAILKTPQEKLAALVDSVASVVVNERNLKLYIRSFMYNRNELQQLMQCFHLITNRNIVVMTKEVPHDFFVTHPVSWWIEDIPFPVIIEFDAAHEFNGQGIVSSLFPGTHLDRWKHYRKLSNVTGFSIRTDRYGKTSILGRPAEINLFALHEAVKDPSATNEEIIDRFIYQTYDSLSYPFIRKAFDLAPEIILSSFYTLGLNTTNHSVLDFDYRSIYSRHVSGRWMDNPEIPIAHGVNQTFHYWKDIVNHLAPARHKTAEGVNLEEMPEVFQNDWIQAEELMDTTWLGYVLTEKINGVEKAREALASINSAKTYCTDSRRFNQLYHTFNRTLLSARLRKAYAQVYYGLRIWNRGEEFQNEKLRSLLTDGIYEITTVSQEIRNYRRKGPEGGQYDWAEDAGIALTLAGEAENTIMANKRKR